jgi:UDP-3-O-[3-hydroxymyristoyl] glucosamine N-acyltransferase
LHNPTKARHTSANLTCKAVLHVKDTFRLLSFRYNQGMRLRNLTYPLATISERSDGRIIGGADRVVRGMCTLDAPREDYLTFIRSQSSRALVRAVSQLKGAIAFVQEGLLPPDHPLESTSLIVVKEPYTAFLDTIPLFFEELEAPISIAPSALIDPTAKIDETASIGHFCVIGAHVTIGPNCVLHSNVIVAEGSTVGASTVLHSGVVVREYSVLGAHCTVHNNSIIGSDGFGYVPDKQRGLRKVPQVGTVEIADYVEIGANSCIDRGAVGATTIGRGTKIDNLVQIGHNVQVGSYCIICAQVGIAGSTTIGDGVVLAGQVGIADHLSIPKGSRVGGGSSITEDIPESGDYMGYPVMKVRDWQRRSADLRRTARRKQRGSTTEGSS